jgi:hypothetical protein
MGDKVIEQGSATLNWSSSNSDSIHLTSFGAVAASGAQSVSPTPAQTTNGLVEEDASYILTATNVCGGAEVKTVVVRIKGSIEPVPAVLLKSVFYPTDYPDRRNRDLGLLSSQRQALTTLASGFVKYLEYDPGARLSLVAHADPRGGTKYNDSLSLRRAELTKQFLVSKGIAPEKIETSSEGIGNPLDDQLVAQLEALNPNPLPAARTVRKSSTLFAYQRRVDIVLSPTNAESVRFYPTEASDLQILWQRPKPTRNAVERNQ